MTKKPFLSLLIKKLLVCRTNDQEITIRQADFQPISRCRVSYSSKVKFSDSYSIEHLICSVSFEDDYFSSIKCVKELQNCSYSRRTRFDGALVNFTRSD